MILLGGVFFFCGADFFLIVDVDVVDVVDSVVKIAILAIFISTTSTKVFLM